MSERIAIVGGSVRAAAMSAVRAGFRVAAADRFADEDLRQIAAATRVDDYPRGLVPWLRTLDPPAHAWMYTGGLENHPDLVDELAGIAPLWGNAGDVLRQVRSPWILADALRSAGLRFPEMRDSPASLPSDGSWLAKTGRGASGSGVAAFDGAVADDVVYQRRMAGIPGSALYVAANGQAALLGVARQLVGESWLHAGEFQYCGAISPWPVVEATLPEIRRIGEALAKRFRLSGLFGVDFILDDDRIWTVEINPRYTASTEVIERVAGLRAINVQAEACSNSTLPPTIRSAVTRLCGKAILFAREAVTVSCEFNQDVFPVASVAAFSHLADLPSRGMQIESRSPVLTVFAAGATADEVVTNLKTRVAEIESQLYV